MSSGLSVETASVVTHASSRRDSPRAPSHGRLGAAAPARDHGGHRRAPARLDRLARTRSRAAVGARPADALPAARRGRRLSPHRARGQPADGSPPARPSRPRGGARDRARADPRDGQARDRGVVLQLDADRLVVAHVDGARGSRRGRHQPVRRRRSGPGTRPPVHPSPKTSSGRRSTGSSSAPFRSPRRRA